LPDKIEKRKHPRVAVAWPVTIIAEDGAVEGETKNITIEGVFIHCTQRLLPGNTYRMVIKPPQGPIEVEGELVWSNLDNLGQRNAVSGMGFYFVKVADEDRESLSEAISAQKV
jgi:hypothetical protein